MGTYLKNSEPENCTAGPLEVALDEIEAVEEEIPGCKNRYPTQVKDFAIVSGPQKEEQKQRDGNPNQRCGQVKAAYYCGRSGCVHQNNG